MDHQILNRMKRDLDLPEAQHPRDTRHIHVAQNRFEPEYRERYAHYYDKNIIPKFCAEGECGPELLIKADKLHKTINQYVLALKHHFNHKRPHELEGSTIDPIYLASAQTPSYPSGHAALYYGLYRLFSNKNPSLSHKYLELAQRGAHSRILAGVHFHQDNEASGELINILAQEKPELFI